VVTSSTILMQGARICSLVHHTLKLSGSWTARLCSAVAERPVGSVSLPQGLDKREVVAVSLYQSFRWGSKGLGWIESAIFMILIKFVIAVAAITSRISSNAPKLFTDNPHP
jgi:hypothetical protein